MKQKDFTIIVFIILVVILAGVLGYFTLIKKLTPPVGIEQKQQKREENMAKIKIGKYERKYVSTNGNAWEEVVYKSTIIIEDEDEIYRAFSRLYPEYTNPQNELYIKDIILRGDVAEVYFGGDEEKLVNRMGTAGAYTYTGLVTFALTEDVRIKKVDFKLRTVGEHFGPRRVSREDYIYLWTIPMLKEAAKNGNEYAKELLDFRTTP